MNSCVKLKSNLHELSLTKVALDLKTKAKLLLQIIDNSIVKIKDFLYSTLLHSWSLFTLKDKPTKKEISSLQQLNLIPEEA